MGVEASTSKIDTININNGKVEGVAVGSERLHTMGLFRSV